MGLEARWVPDPSEAGGADSGGLGLGAGPPVGGARRRFLGGPGNDLVEAPAGHGLAGDSQLDGAPFGALAGGGRQDDAGAFHQAGWEGVTTGKALEVVVLFLGQPDLGGAGHDV